MKKFTVHLSDTAAIDFRTTIEIEEGESVSVAAKAALDEFLQMQQPEAEFRFPLFIDIHPAAEFEESAWMYSRSA